MIFFFFLDPRDKFLSLSCPCYCLRERAEGVKIYDSVLCLVPALSTHSVQVFERACRAAKQAYAESDYCSVRTRVVS